MMRALGYGKIPGIDTISVNLSDAVKMEIMTSKANHPHTSDVVGKRKKKPLLLIMDESKNWHLHTSTPLSDEKTLRDYWKISITEN